MPGELGNAAVAGVMTPLTPLAPFYLFFTFHTVFLFFYAPHWFIYFILFSAGASRGAFLGA